MTEWSKVGKRSRKAGANFELRCRKTMTKITGWPCWRRAVAGHEQHHGDLVAVDSPGGVHTGEIASTQLGRMYVECKWRTKLTEKDILDFKTYANENRPEGKYWVLLVGQPNSPVLIFMEEECALRFLVGGEVCYLDCKLDLGLGRIT